MARGSMAKEWAPVRLGSGLRLPPASAAWVASPGTGLVWMEPLGAGRKRLTMARPVSWT